MYVNPFISNRQRGIPNYKYTKGKITFAKAKMLKTAIEEPMVRPHPLTTPYTLLFLLQEEIEEGFVAFQGSGQKLKTSKKRTHPRR